MGTHKRMYYTMLGLLVLVLFSGFFWFYETRFLVGRADVTAYSFSVENSYAFVSPLQARANGQEKVRITVLVLNNQGLGVPGKKVELSKDENLNEQVIQGLTDSVGKAVFDISSEKAGDYYVDAKIEGTSLTQKIRLTFTP